MNAISIFFSWQNFEKNINRFYLEEVIKDAIEQANKTDDSNPKVQLDQATRSVPGSPDIASTLFDKIDNCSYFIADLSFVAEAISEGESSSSRKFPNSNVLIELGYASKKIGWDRIMLLFNNQYGKVEELPFDIRGRRVQVFKNYRGQTKIDRTQQSKNLLSVITTIFNDLRKNTQPLENHPVTKIYTFLNNRILSCLTDWEHMIKIMYRDAKIPFNKRLFEKEDLEKVCLAVNPNYAVNHVVSLEDGHMNFDTWLAFVRFKGKKIQKVIFELLTFHRAQLGFVPHPLS